MNTNPQYKISNKVEDSNACRPMLLTLKKRRFGNNQDAPCQILILSLRKLSVPAHILQYFQRFGKHQ